MSSILKALEKAEESNSVRRNGIESGLIRTRQSRPAWVMPVAVLCGAAVATLATYAAMGGFSRQAPVAQASRAVAETTPTPVAPLSPAAEKPAAQPAAAVEPTVAAKPAVIPKSAVSAKAGLAPTSSTAPDSKAASHPVTSTKAVKTAAVPALRPASQKSSQVHPAQAHIAMPATAATSSEAAAKGNPELRVTGIAWQNNGESSFAVVNGRAVLQGGVVDGYKVVEIHHDMVRFSGSTGTIDVPLEN